MATLDGLKKELTAPKERPETFPAMLEAFKGEIIKALPKHLNGDRIARIALTCFRQNPKLQECEPRSIFACVIQSAQLGLELGMSGRAFIIPYGNNATFVPGWRGLVELANRTGRASVWTGAVYEGDSFDYQLGDSPYLNHKPTGDDETLTHVYAIGRVKGSEYPVIEVWPVKKVEKHRDRYNKIGKRHYSYEHFELYARKVALLQVLKYLPSSAELETAVALNDMAEINQQRLTVKDAIEGTWAPAPADAPPPEEPSENPAPPDIQPDAPLTYAHVAAAINSAKDTDTLDMAADLIGSVKDLKHRVELTSMYKARRETLE